MLSPADAIVITVFDIAAIPLAKARAYFAFEIFFSFLSKKSTVGLPTLVYVKPGVVPLKTLSMVSESSNSNAAPS